MLGVLVYMCMQLLGKHVLVTGGTSGLGLSLSKLLVEKGARVWGLGHTQESVDRARSVLPVSTFVPKQCSVLDQHAMRAVVESMEHVDILVNCAGIFIEGMVEDNDEEKVSMVVDVNLKGVIYTTQAVLPQMKQRNSGVIVNVSSTAGLKPKQLQSVYVATKFGVRGFTESIKLDLKGTNIDVLGFYPSKMNTALMENSGYHKDTSNWMNPDEVAEVLIFMLERPASMRMDKVVVKRRT